MAPRRPGPASYSRRHSGDTFAVIDAGSNAIRLQIASVAAPGTYQVLEQDRQPVRLGHGVFETGVLDGKTRELALRVLKRFKSRADRYRVKAMRAVATSAMREARDAATFVEAAAEFGIRLEILSEQDEARLTTLGILTGLTFDPPTALFVDIGGGSTEIATGSRCGTTAAISLPLGAVRLTERYIPDDPPLDEQCNAMTAFIRTQLAGDAKSLTKETLGMAFGSGGTFTSLAYMDARLKGVRRVEFPYSLDLGRIKELYERVRTQPLRERATLLDGNRRRASLLVAGTAVLLAVLQEFRIDLAYASGRGLRDGLMVGLLRESLPAHSGEWHSKRTAAARSHIS